MENQINNPVKPKSKVGPKTKIILASVGALAFLIVAGGSVMAASQASTNQTTFINRVASLVGVDSTKLTDAVKTASTEQVKQDVTNGKLTQTEADKIISDIDSGKIPLGAGGPGGERGGPKGGMGGPVNMDGLASFLGLSTADLKIKQDSGTTLLDIAVAQGKTEDQLKTYLSTEMDQKLKDDVASGKITQVKADDMATKKDEMITRMISDTHGPRERGFGRP